MTTGDANRSRGSVGEPEDYAEIREQVARLCAKYPGEYWRDLDARRGPFARVVEQVADEIGEILRFAAKFQAGRTWLPTTALRFRTVSRKMQVSTTASVLPDTRIPYTAPLKPKCMTSGIPSRNVAVPLAK